MLMKNPCRQLIPKTGIQAGCAVLAVCAMFLFAPVCPVVAATPAPVPGQLLLAVNQGWQARFDPATAMLECLHAPTGTRLVGRLSFVVARAGQPADWKVAASRDFAERRLALVDERQNIQGYVAISGDASRLDLTVLSRPPLSYAGELVFAPQITFGSRAFACRTRVPARTSVVPMASGAADSLLNDSLFDPERDLVLNFSGRKVVLETAPEPAVRGITFQAGLAASVERVDGASISMELVPDYYRSRYVPNYRTIDRRRCPTPPTGWMSWNVYFDTAGEKENLDEARLGARYLKPFGLEIWSIESWQDNSPRLPVSDFHNLTLRPSPEKFPHGMKWLAGEIKALGFRPGIWTVPWGTGDVKFYLAHRDWFLHDADGKPMKNWNGRYVLDPSQAAVRRQMEESHRTMSADWGYEFFKIDGISGRGPGLSAHFFERSEVRAAFRETVINPYALCIEALRRGIGPDRIFLACQGHYTGPEVAWADAARLGADIVHPNEPPHWANYLDQAGIVQAQLFAHNLIWYGDPDTLLVGEPAPLNSARIATTVVALPGQLTFFGDKLGPLPPARMRLLQQALPVCDVRPLDLVPNPELKPIWDLKLRRSFASWDVVSVFNWNDQPGAFKFSFAELGLSPGKAYLVYDFWNRQFLGSLREGMECRVDARANSLLAIHENLGRPQLLSTDRHITQGGVEWTGETWNPARQELVCSFMLVENDPLTAVIHVPSSCQLVAAKSAGATVAQKINDSIISVTLRRATSGEVRLVLTFTGSAR